MSISSAMYTAITGLNSMGEAMSVVGDNIANVNTIGFKKARPYFMDILSQTTHTAVGSAQIGKGVNIGTINSVFSQGAFQNSDETTNLAISGEGFFVVKNPDTNELFYTRAGNFTIDDQGHLVSPLNYIVQGWQLNNGARTGSTGDITLTTTNLEPSPTSQATFILNLEAGKDSRSSDLWAVWDGRENNPIDGNRYAYQTSIRVYDSLGGAHDISVYFDPDHNPEKSSLTWSPDGTNEIELEAVNGGLISNSISMSVETPTGAGPSDLSVSVNNNYEIIITLAQDATGDTNIAANSLDNIIAALEADDDASGLVTVAQGATYTGTDILSAAVAEENLTGGSDIDTTPNTWEYIVCCDPDEDARTVGGEDIQETDFAQYAGLLMRGTITFDPNTGGIDTSLPDAITASQIVDWNADNTPVWSNEDGDTTTDMTPTMDGYFQASARFLRETDAQAALTTALDDQLIQINFGARHMSDVWVNDNFSSSQFSTTSTTLYQTQDGFAAGFLQSLSVANDGTVYGSYTNGQTIGTYQLVLATFQDQWALQKHGQNLFSATQESGDAAENTPGEGGAGVIHSNALEQSNVDLAEEFVDMIVIQRGFQANSKIITTTDTMLTELIQLKR